MKKEDNDNSSSRPGVPEEQGTAPGIRISADSGQRRHGGVDRSGTCSQQNEIPDSRSSEISQNTAEAALSIGSTVNNQPNTSGQLNVLQGASTPEISRNATDAAQLIGSTVRNQPSTSGHPNVMPGTRAPEMSRSNADAAQLIGSSVKSEPSTSGRQNVMPGAEPSISRSTTDATQFRGYAVRNQPSTSGHQTVVVEPTERNNSASPSKQAPCASSKAQTTEASRSVAAERDRSPIGRANAISEEEDLCPICFDELGRNGPIVTGGARQCRRHRFHRECLDAWHRIETSCPVCRAGRPCNPCQCL